MLECTNQGYPSSNKEKPKEQIICGKIPPDSNEPSGLKMWKYVSKDPKNISREGKALRWRPDMLRLQMEIQIILQK